MNQEWTESEDRLVIQTYRRLLDFAAAGQAINGSAEVRGLASGSLSPRSEGAIGRRMQAISAVLVADGHPHLPRFPPRDRLGTGVEQRLRTALIQTLPSDPEWSDDELLAAVVGYFGIFEAEQRGEAVNKRELNRLLRQGPLARRSHAAVEWRMQNISAIMQSMERPWVPGYKPAAHVGTGPAARLRNAIAKAEGVAADSPEESLTVAVMVERTRRRLGFPGAEPIGTSTVSVYTTTVRQFRRDPRVIAWVLELANGSCEACDEPAPFADRRGEPFLEIHHVRPLGQGGPDTVDNAVALCPNCHRRLHLAADAHVTRGALLKKLPRLRDHPPSLT